MLDLYGYTYKPTHEKFVYKTNETLKSIDH